MQAKRLVGQPLTASFTLDGPPMGRLWRILEIQVFGALSTGAPQVTAYKRPRGGPNVSPPYGVYTNYFITDAVDSATYTAIAVMAAPNFSYLRVNNFGGPGVLFNIPLAEVDLYEQEELRLDTGLAGFNYVVTLEEYWNEV
jgi:hypothetical protein